MWPHAVFVGRKSIIYQFYSGHQSQGNPNSARHSMATRTRNKDKKAASVAASFPPAMPPVGPPEKNVLLNSYWCIILRQWSYWFQNGLILFVVSMILPLSFQIYHNPLFDGIWAPDPNFIKRVSNALHTIAFYDSIIFHRVFTIAFGSPVETTYFVSVVVGWMSQMHAEDATREMCWGKIFLV